jgi:uncharacterized protein with NRDE domain
MALEIVAMVEEQVPATLSDGTEGVVTLTTLYIPPMYYGGHATKISTTSLCDDFERHIKVFESHDEAYSYAESLLYG